MDLASLFSLGTSAPNWGIIGDSACSEARPWGYPEGIRVMSSSWLETSVDFSSIQVSPRPSLRHLTTQNCPPSTSERTFGANVAMVTMVPAIVIHYSQGRELHDLESNQKQLMSWKEQWTGSPGACIWPRQSYYQAE